MTTWVKPIEWGFYSILATTLFAFGGLYVGGYTLFEGLTLLVGAALVLHALYVGRLPSARTVPLVFVVLSLWTAYLFFQLIPLPTAWVEFLSPKRVELLRQFAPVLAGGGNRISLSLGTYEMWVQVFKSVAFTAVFFIAYALIYDKLRLRRFCLVAIVLGSAISFLGPLFSRIDSSKVYGFFTLPSDTPFTPFSNDNHFANYLVMTLPLTLAFILMMFDRSNRLKHRHLNELLLWFGSRQATGVLILVAAFVFQLLALVQASSRGGALGALAAMACFALVLVLRSKNPKFALVTLSIAAFALILGVTQAKPLLAKFMNLEGFSAQELLAQFRLAEEYGFIRDVEIPDLSLFFRLAVWKDTLRMFSDFPFFGIGVGGFEGFFPMYKSVPEMANFGTTIFRYPENDLLQGFSEMGLIGSALLFSVGVVLLVRWTRRHSHNQSKTVSWISCGVLSAICGMLVHSLVDFPTHIPANMVLLASLGGIFTRLVYSESLPREVSALRPAKGVGVILRLLIGAPVVLALVAFATPALWYQWRTEKLYRQGTEALKEGVQGDSLQLPAIHSGFNSFQKALKRGRHQSSIHEALGRNYVYLGLLDKAELAKRDMWFLEAEKSLERAILLAPHRADHHYSLSWLYGQWEKHNLAEVVLERVIRLAPRKPIYFYSYGVNQLHLKNKEKALDAFRMAIGINMNFTEQILAAMKKSNLEFTEEDFADLVPGEEHQRPEGIASRIVRYFYEQKQMELAVSLQHLFAL